MSEEYRKAYVYIRNIYAGILRETDEGYTFRYDEDYLSREDKSPVSITMPFQKEAYISKTMFPFFDGLIPEGWMLDVVCHNWKLKPNDRFGILLVSCRDPIGNVSIREERK